MAIPGFRVLKRDYQGVQTQVNGAQYIADVPGANVSAMATDISNATSQRVAQSRQQNTQLIGSATESLARANEYAGTPGRISSNIGGTLAQLGLGIADALTKIQDSKRKAQIEQAKIDFMQEAQALSSDAAALTRGEGGIYAYRNAAQELVNKYQSLGVPAEDLAPGLSLLFDEHRREQRRIDEATFEEAKSLTEKTRAADVARLSSKYVTSIASLSTGLSAQGHEETRTFILDSLAQDLTGVDPFTGAMLVESVFNQLNSELFKNNVRVQSIAVAVQKLSEAQATDTQAYNTALSTGDWNTYIDTISQLKATLPEEVQKIWVPNLDKSQQVLNMAMQQSNYASQLANAANRKLPFSADLDLAGLNRKQIGATAYLLANDPAALALVKTTYATSRIDLGSASLPPTMQAVVTLAEEFRQFESEVKPKLQQDITKQQQSIARFNLTATQDWFQFELATRSAENADAEALALSQIFRDKLGIGDIPVTNITPEQRAAYQSQWLQFRNEYLTQMQVELSQSSDALNREYARYAQYGLYYNEPTAGYIPIKINTGEVFTEVDEVLTRVRNISNTYQQQPGGMQPNFNMPQLHSQRTAEGKELVFPFAPLGSPIVFEPNQTYGADRQNADGSRRPHQGLDFGLEPNTPIINYTTGTVISAGSRGGYGIVVEVESPDGSNHFFAHLNAAQVRVGQKVKPGDVLGLSGNTGEGSGYHLHWEVRVNGQHVNPLDYASGIRRQLQQVRSAAPAGMPNGFIPVGNGQFVSSPSNAMAYASQGVLAPLEFSNSNPARLQFAPASRYDYAYEPSKNYSYAALKDKSLREALHNVARRNNIPAQWLADIIQKESNWRADNENPSSGAVGLIQWLPSTIQDRATMGDLATSPFLLKRLSAVEQMEYVDRYISFIRKVAGDIETADQLVVGIFLGAGTLQQYKHNPNSVLDMRDGTGYSLREYLLDLGRAGGRQYNTPATRVVTHTSYEPGCATCQQISSVDSFVIHEALLA